MLLTTQHVITYAKATQTVDMDPEPIEQTMEEPKVNKIVPVVPVNVEEVVMKPQGE